MKDWTVDASCLGAWDNDPELYAALFSDKAAEQAKAKLVCAQCPVRRQCLEEGLHERTGIRGGLGVRERQRLVTRRRSVAA